MGTFAETAPTIAGAGVTEQEALDEIDTPDPVVPPTEPTLRAIDVRRICKFASVHGREPSTIKNAAKRAMAQQSIEEFALLQGLWPEQVRRVMDEWFALVKSATG